jgi:Zn-dependent peptidase ImmA (M78 family)/DNA-binding XRE family transcriptional regulator
MSNINPVRIRELRQRAGLSQGDLAQKLGVTPSLVSRWEGGERVPSPRHIVDLARAVGVSLDYALNADDVRPKFRFRANAVSDVFAREDINATVSHADQMIMHIQSAYRKARKPLMLNPLQYDLASVPDQALPEFVGELRITLRLNRFVTLAELKQVLQEGRIHVFEWRMPREISGMSWRGPFAVVFINANHTHERRLFSLAHELAHVLFHFGADDAEPHVSAIHSRRPEEQFANAFASELLMPDATVSAVLREYADRLHDPQGLESIARHFHVSRDAMFYRLAERNIYRPTEHDRFFAPFDKTVRCQIDPHVTDIDAQVDGEFLRTALQCYDSEEVSAGKLSEWLFAPRPTIERYLSARCFEVEDLIGNG